MITNSNGDKVSAKEHAKEYLNQAIKVALENYTGGEQMTDKEVEKAKEQLDKVSARLLSKLEPAAGKVQEG